MDILGADDMKWYVRIVAKIVQNKLQKEMIDKYHIRIPEGKTFIDLVHDDLRMCPNQGIRKIYKKLLLAGEAMPTQHHSSMIVDLGSFILWITFKDTAYRDPLFWIMDGLLSDPDFKNDIQQLVVKNPKDWYCPQWIASKKETKRLKDEGKLEEFGLSPAEKIFVPEEQINNINNELKKQIERERLKNV